MKKGIDFCVKLRIIDYALRSWRRGRPPKQHNAELCKGSTTDSGSVCEGSNPSPAAIKHRIPLEYGAFFVCYSPVTHLSLIDKVSFSRLRHLIRFTQRDLFLTFALTKNSYVI